jgi:hypothetical protein
MKLGLLEIERQVLNGSPNQQDLPLASLAINSNNSKVSLTAQPAIHRVRTFAFRTVLAIRRMSLVACRLAWTIGTYRTLVNELDNLTEADLRDLSIEPKDVASIAWKEARRRGAERFHPDTDDRFAVGPFLERRIL